MVIFFFNPYLNCLHTTPEPMVENYPWSYCVTLYRLVVLFQGVSWSLALFCFFTVTVRWNNVQLFPSPDVIKHWQCPADHSGERQELYRVSLHHKPLAVLTSVRKGTKYNHWLWNKGLHVWTSTDCKQCIRPSCYCIYIDWCKWKFIFIKKGLFSFPF